MPTIQTLLHAPRRTYLQPTPRSLLRTPLTALLIFAFTIPASAQWQDYIVTLAHDTIYGDLQFRFSTPSALETEDSSYPVNIRSVESWFSASHKILTRRRMLPGKKKYLFLPVLESGAINLYVYTLNGGVNGTTTTAYYAEKRDSPLVEVWTNHGFLGSDNKTRRLALAALIADNPAVKQTFDGDTKYDAIDAQYYIHEYNITTTSAP